MYSTCIRHVVDFNRGYIVSPNIPWGPGLDTAPPLNIFPPAQVFPPQSGLEYEDIMDTLTVAGSFGIFD